MMGHRTSNSGFTLLEMLMVTACLSALAMFVIPANEWKDEEGYGWTYDYWETQSRAIFTAERQEMPSGSQPCISFNAVGGVRQAETVRFGRKETVIELGGGRLVFRRRLSAG